MSTIRTAAWAMLLLAPGLAQADCPATLATLNDDLGLALDAYTARDEEGNRTPDYEGFTAAATSAETHLGCLSEPLTPADAAAYHRMKAIGAEINGSPGAMSQSFRAAVAADKSYIFPMTIAPRGSTLRNGYSEALAQPTPERIEMGLPAETSAIVDGTAADSRPDGVPTIVQLVAADGSVTATEYVDAGGEGPSFAEPVVAEAPPESPPVFEDEHDRLMAEVATRPDPLPIEPPPSGDPRVPLLAAAGASAVAGVALFGVASGANSRFNDANTPDSELAGLRSQANTLGYAAQGALVAAVGLAVVGVAVDF